MYRALFENIHQSLALAVVVNVVLYSELRSQIVILLFFMSFVLLALLQMGFRQLLKDKVDHQAIHGKLRDKFLFGFIQSLLSQSVERIYFLFILLVFEGVFVYPIFLYVDDQRV